MRDFNIVNAEMVTDPEFWAIESLLSLETFLVAGNLVHRAFNKPPVEIGDSSRFPYFETPIGLLAPPANETTHFATLDKVERSFFVLTKDQQALSLDALQKQYIQPAMRSLAKKIDKDILAKFFKIEAFVGVPGKHITTDMLVDCRADLTLNKASLEDRYFIVGPKGEADLLKNKEITVSETNPHSLGNKHGFAIVLGSDFCINVAFQKEAVGILMGPIKKEHLIPNESRGTLMDYKGLGIKTDVWRAGDNLNVALTALYGVSVLNPQFAIKVLG